MSSPRRAVYTAVIGGYETVLSSPPDSTVDYICFTDDPDLTSDRWRIERVDPLLPGDPVRSARHLKIVGHPLLDGYDETLWVDNRVELLTDPAELLADWLSDADISMPWHSFRETVVDEFVAVLESGLDDPSRPQEQLLHYLAHEPDALQERPYWTALVARRSTPEVAEAMARWRDHVMRYSRRDQLSVNVALRQSGVRVTVQPLESSGSGQHVWRGTDEVGRRPSDAVRRSFATALLPPAVQVRDLERQRDESAALVTTLREAADGLVRELGDSERARRSADAEIAQLRTTVDAAAQESGALRSKVETLEAENAAVRGELDSTGRERDALGARCHELLTSTSWKITRPVRAALGAVRRGSSAT